MCDICVIPCRHICSINLNLYLTNFIEIMKKSFLFIALLSVITLASCKEDAVTPTTTPTATDQPVGAFTAQRTGSLVAQSGTPTKGIAQLGMDTKGTAFLKLGSDFTSDYHTGAVTLYMSKGATYAASTVQLISGVSKNGEQYFKLSAVVSSDFTHLIVWCGSAKIPFGNAELK